VESVILPYVLFKGAAMTYLNENFSRRSPRRFANIRGCDPRPPQCGKSTLAKHLLAGRKNGLYLDLEKPSDLANSTTQNFFSLPAAAAYLPRRNSAKAGTFPLIRSLVDDWGGNGHFLVLGSASRDLLGQSSETLAGRISYKRLTRFSTAKSTASRPRKRTSLGVAFRRVS
jgi:predicted AAA+ superfamily ATPase